MTKIPDRWLQYTAIGKVIPRTRIIAFKVPLHENISSKVDKDISLDIKKLLKEIPNLGLVIDLTNTYRYYNPRGLTSKGVQYEKLMIPGHEIPTRRLSDQFNRIVDRFLRWNKSNDKLIGVHCTHGVNRTGYLICNYLVNSLYFAPNSAIRMFEDARGHSIERDNYCQSLLANVRSSLRDTDRGRSNKNAKKRKHFYHS